MPYYVIDPDERLDFTFDWASFLADAGSPPDVIAQSSFAIASLEAYSPTGPSLSGTTSDTTSATVFVANARVGAIYRLTNRIVTGAGRIAERSISLRCEEQ
jgi:hypothetical protein